MTQRVNALSMVCKCGCGEKFKPKRKDQLFFLGHREPYYKKANEIGVELINRFGTEISIDKITVNGFIKKTKKKKDGWDWPLEKSEALQKLLNKLKHGSHSTLALSTNLGLINIATLISALRWNLIKREDLPGEYKAFQGRDILCTRKYVKKKLICYYKLEPNYKKEIM